MIYSATLISTTINALNEVLEVLNGAVYQPHNPIISWNEHRLDLTSNLHNLDTYQCGVDIAENFLNGGEGSPVGEGVAIAFLDLLNE